MGRLFSNACLLFMITALCACGALLKPRSSIEGEDRGGRSSQSNDMDGGMAMDADGGSMDGSSDGNSDGNADGNSDGNADGNTDGDPEPECQRNEDCEPGERCIGGICQTEEGCDSDDDCDDGLHCDPDLGPTGACVICVNADHCEDDELCVNNDCRFSCADNPNACENGQYCDAATDTCVDCLEDEQCELGLSLIHI